jgi:small subunit ribosomal protein S16
LSVKIRLARKGRNKVACYRIVAADSRMARDGRFLETLGTYNPQAQPKEFTLKADRVAYWIKKGAQPTETVANLLRQDRFEQKIEAIDKGVAADSVGAERMPERKRKAKPTKKSS